MVDSTNDALATGAAFTTVEPEDINAIKQARIKTRLFIRSIHLHNIATNISVKPPRLWY